ncbi:hypothetical protein GCM10023161_42080 [Mycobacterium paraffinicum]|uniref:Uncharacterized protein n=1 Tax=Mycobacterium paraffinicum TaxID=53378 RepID=A0ABP8F3B7_9MYCO
MHGKGRPTEQELVRLAATARIKHRFSAECLAAAGLKNGPVLASPDVSRKTEQPPIVNSSSPDARVTDKCMRTSTSELPSAAAPCRIFAILNILVKR